jgi:hypothetical protein
LPDSELLIHQPQRFIASPVMFSRPAAVYWDAAFVQAAISGLVAALRERHDADRSVGKATAFLLLPQ